MIRKLVLVLPELSPEASTQYAHFVPLARELAREVQVCIVVEGGKAPALDDVTVRAQRWRFPAARALELAWILLGLRVRGYRHAYGAYSPYFGIMAGALGRLLGMRTAYWHCRGDFFNARVARPWLLRDLVLDTLPLVFSLHLSRIVLTGTASLAASYARRFRLVPSRIRVVPNALDVASAESRGVRRPGPTPRLLFVGRLTDHKGGDLLPSIFRTVARSMPEAQLVVVGDGPLGPRLAAEFTAERIQGRVVLAGSRPNPEARRQMAEADLLLLPSRSEGFPRVLLEAMAAGLPFAATAVGGVAEIVAPPAVKLLAAPGDPEAVADMATLILRDPTLHRELAEAGSLRVRDFDVGIVASRLLEAMA